MTDYARFFSTVGEQLQESAIRRMGTVIAERSDLVSFAPGYPDAALFPRSELTAICAELLAVTDGSALQYGPTRGHPALMEVIVGLLQERHIHVATEDLLITSGSQQGIDLAARLLLNPGDVVLVELPTFTGGIAAFRNAQAHLVGVPQTADGIDPEALDGAWVRETGAGRRVKLLYLIPNFQNPTGALMSLARRRQILEWASRRDVLIIEDDPYGSLYFEDQASEADTRPIRADDEDGRVIYLSTFSKTLAPGFRVGWVVAPRALVGRFETAKQSVDLACGSLDQRVACEAVRRGLIARLAPALRARYRMKRDLMEGALRRYAGEALTWDTPRGGFFVWATLRANDDDNALLKRAMAHRVVFVPGSAFHVDGSGRQTIRLSFSEPAPETIEEGVRRLAAVLQPEVAAR